MSDRSESVSTAIPENGNSRPAPDGGALVPVNAAVPELQAQAGPLMLQTVTLETLVDRVKLIKAAMKRCMVEGQHYGTVPGTKKPSLWKPGAELICTLFQLGTRYPNHCNQVAREQGHFTFTLTCELFHIPSGRVIGEGVGACATREYRYRVQTEERHTDQGQLIKAKYTPYDFYNTALKIGKKRAMVDAVLTVTGASEIFTQDLEDDPEKYRHGPEPQPARRPLSQGPQRTPTPQQGNGAHETLTGVVERAWPNDHQGKRYYFARINGQQLQTTDPAQGEELLHAIGQEIRAVVEPSPKPGKFYVKAFRCVDPKETEEAGQPGDSPLNSNGKTPHAAPAEWTPGRREELCAEVQRAWPNDYEGTRFFFAKLKGGNQLQTRDPALGQTLLQKAGQPLQALVECAAKPGKFYLIAFGKEPEVAGVVEAPKPEPKPLPPAPEQPFAGVIDQAWKQGEPGNATYVVRVGGIHLQTQAPEVGERLIGMQGQTLKAVARPGTKPSTMDFIRFADAAPAASVENPNVERVARRKAARARHEAKGQTPVTDGDDQIPMD